MSKQYSFERMQSVRKLINKKMMLVDAKNYHVAMLAELWNLYDDEGKIHFCQNIFNYCMVENSYSQIKSKKDVLLISIKDSNDYVAPYAYFKDEKIELIENSRLIRDVPKKVANYLFKKKLFS